MGAKCGHAQNTEKGMYEIKKEEVLIGKENVYIIEKFLGQGMFGKVVQCSRAHSKEKMAVKIVRKDMYHNAQREAATLQKLKALDHEKNNLVKFTEHFLHRGHVCLAFEMLDISICDLIGSRGYKPFSLSEIKVITRQMLVALNALNSIGLSHTDIKPDNIMFVNCALQPLKVKLIDFGLATATSNMLLGVRMQPIGYRAPEVVLGLPLGEAVDMWSLGCVLAFMYIGHNLYPVRCVYQYMRVIVKILGLPDDNMLNAGLYTNWYFSRDIHSHRSQWRLNTKTEFMEAKGSTTQQLPGIFDRLTCLEDIVAFHKDFMDHNTGFEDTGAFLSILRQMLCIDPKKRITTNEALKHRFITMKWPPTYSNRNLFKPSIASMIKKDRLKESSGKFKHFLPSIEVLSFEEESKPSDEETSLCSSNESKATNSFADATTSAGTSASYEYSSTPEKVSTYVTASAETNEEMSELDGATSPASGGDSSDSTVPSEGTAGLVEVKPRFLMRVRRFFLRLVYRRSKKRSNLK